MKIKYILLPALLLAAIGLCIAALALFLISPRTAAEKAIAYVLKVAPGTTVRRVANELYAEKIIRSRTAFYYAARFSNFHLKAGRFSVASSMSIPQLLTHLSSNTQMSVKVSVPEGYTSSQIAALLEKNEITGAADFLAAAADRSLLLSYGIEAKSAEGYLFPDTYFLDPGMAAENVVRIMIDTFFTRLDAAGIPADNPQKLFELVTLASIVEREYRVPEEAPLMASVFKNRLKYNIGLESCATIVYILTEIKGQPHQGFVTLDDLKIDSDYNTYKWAGLPPGPISNPGMTALNAAANPPETDYYYFRIADQAKGTHSFTKTLSEHAQAGLSVKK